MTEKDKKGYVATLPTSGPLLILPPALKRRGSPRREGLCSRRRQSTLFRATILGSVEPPPPPLWGRVPTKIGPCAYTLHMNITCHAKRLQISVLLCHVSFPTPNPPRRFLRRKREVLIVLCFTLCFYFIFFGFYTHAMHT